MMAISIKYTFYRFVMPEVLMFFSVYKHVLKLILIATSALDFFITITCVGEGFIEMVKM